jgi:hypothetical protein
MTGDDVWKVSVTAVFFLQLLFDGLHIMSGILTPIYVKLHEWAEGHHFADHDFDCTYLMYSLGSQNPTRSL